METQKLPTTTNGSGLQSTSKENQNGLDSEQSTKEDCLDTNATTTNCTKVDSPKVGDDKASNVTLGKGEDSNETTTGTNSNSANHDDAKGFDFSAVMNSLAGLTNDSGLLFKGRKLIGENNDKQEHQDGNESVTNHDESKDDVNVPLEELPIETKDDLPDIILENRQFDADEELMFEHRCKLYRFDTSDSEEGSQWKERGVGNLTIVRRSVGTNYAYRILMRRDKVFKLCANHFIRGDMQLKPHGKNNNSFLWSTSADLSEMEPTSETLAARFKTADDAAKFKKAFEEAVDDMNKTDSLQHDDSNPNTEKTVQESKSNVEENNEDLVKDGTTEAS